MDRNVAIAAIAAAALLLVGGLILTRPSEEPAAPEPVELEATQAPPTQTRPELRPTPVEVMDLSPEERERRAAIARERIKQLARERRDRIRGELRDQEGSSGPPLGEAGPAPEPE